jgi:hypothetical protein
MLFTILKYTLITTGAIVWSVPLVMIGSIGGIYLLNMKEFESGKDVKKKYGLVEVGFKHTVNDKK